MNVVNNAETWEDGSTTEKRPGNAANVTGAAHHDPRRTTVDDTQPTPQPATQRVNRTKHYQLEPGTDDLGYYEVVASDGRYLWQWWEPGEPADFPRESWPTRSDALLAAANDAEETIGDLLAGKRLAARLRRAAAMLAKSGGAA